MSRGGGTRLAEPQTGEASDEPENKSDGDQCPIESFTQMKAGQGMTQDMTQMVGALDTPKESGAAGEGTSGNPKFHASFDSTVVEISFGLRMAQS